MFVGQRRKAQQIGKKKSHWHKFASLQATVVGGWKAEAEREGGGVGAGQLRETRQYETCHDRRVNGVLYRRTDGIDEQTVQLFSAVGYILETRGKYSRAENFAKSVLPRFFPTVDEVGLLGSLEAFLHIIGVGKT